MPKDVTKERLSNRRRKGKPRSLMEKINGFMRIGCRRWRGMVDDRGAWQGDQGSH